jgi:hypothetical protein
MQEWSKSKNAISELDKRSRGESDGCTSISGKPRENGPHNINYYSAGSEIIPYTFIVGNNDYDILRR